MEVGGGQDQTGVVGTELSTALVVKVVDSAGNPVKNQIVNFKVIAGGGSMFAGVGITNDSGRTQDLWTLGTSTKDSERVEARAVDPNTGAPLTFAIFRATATAGPPDSISRISGDTQSAPHGTAIADPSLVVRVADRYGNPVPGAVVTWTVLFGGAAVNSPQSPRRRG